MVDDPRLPDTNESLAAHSGNSVTQDCAAVLDGMSDWTWRTDDVGRITALSPAIAKVTGQPAALYRGYCFADWGHFLRPDLADLADSPEFRWRAPFSGPVFAVPDRTGSRRCFTLAGTPVFGPHDGAFLGYCGSAWETADPVPPAGRSADLSGSGLSGMPADALRQLTLLSHDIRDPLNAMLGFVQLMAAVMSDSDETRSVGAYCDDIFAAAQDMLDRLDEALDVAAVQQEVGQLARKPFDLRDLAAACLDMVEPEARRKGVALRLAGSDAPLPVSADPKAMRRVLLTLLGNALQHNQGRGRITLDIRASGPSARVEIRDNGTGMPFERLERLAAPFEPEDTEYVRAAPETWPGLAISRLLVEAQGGRLTLASSSDAGTVACLVLPLGEASRA